jgi:hypothetical protein
MCYGYGRTREAMYVVDNSFSMAGSNMLAMSGLIADNALRKADCRCPRWASCAYSFEPGMGGYNLFLTPRHPFSKTLTNPIDTPDGGSDELPTWALPLIAKL